MVILSLSSLTNIIVWSKLFGYIKGYFGIGMLDEWSGVIEFLRQIINCVDCLSIWVGIIFIYPIILSGIVPIYICFCLPFLVNIFSRMIEKYL